MKHESLREQDWQAIVEKLGGAAAIEESARETKAFRRGRKFKSVLTLLRVLLAYCLNGGSLRGTAAWAAAVNLVDVSDVAVLYRLKMCAPWLERLVATALAASLPETARGRRIRIIDGTTVPKAGGAGNRNALWRFHATFDVATERFDAVVVTDQAEGECLDKIPAEKGELRIADRCYMQPDRIAALIDQGADILVRAGWKSAKWLDTHGNPLDLIALLGSADDIGRIDRPIQAARKAGTPIALRLIAVKKPPQAAAEARRKARRESQRGGHALSAGTLVAADWVILVTTLPAESYPLDALLDLYRLRWRIELAFKRLKSLVGLAGPPGKDEATARAYLLAHLVLILLLEPLVDRIEDSPHWAEAA
jgi:Transposase DDE domain